MRARTGGRARGTVNLSELGTGRWRPGPRRPPKQWVMLPRRFRSSVADASCGSGRLAIGFAAGCPFVGHVWDGLRSVRHYNWHRRRSRSVVGRQKSPSVKPSARVSPGCAKRAGDPAAPAQGSGGHDCSRPAIVGHLPRCPHGCRPSAVHLGRSAYLACHRKRSRAARARVSG
jgi:hypothetical protein